MSYDDEDERPRVPRKKAATRRSALGLTLKIGGGIVGLAVAGAGARIWQTGASGSLSGGPGFDPWRAWTSGSVTGPEGVVLAATLAASPHNSQPWKFAIADKTIDLFADEARNLGAMDPARREMWFALGCAVENMLLGAQSLGFTPTLNLFPVGTQSEHVARVLLFPGERNKPPEAAVLARRRTNRGPYLRARNIPEAGLKTFNGLAERSNTRLVWIAPESAAGKRFIEGTIAATSAIISDADMDRDSMAWVRADLQAVNKTRDGISTLTAGLSPLMTRFVLTLPPKAVLERQPAYWLQLTREVQLPTAPLFGLLAVPNPQDRAALVDAGRLWQRLHLTATSLGMAAQPLNQMMEMADRDRALGRPSQAASDLQQMAGYADSTVIFGFRIGYAETPAEPSPRRGIEQVISS